MQRPPASRRRSCSRAGSPRAAKPALPFSKRCLKRQSATACACSGPNCLGAMRADIGLNATFARTPARPGKLGAGVAVGRRSRRAPRLGRPGGRRLHQRGVARRGGRRRLRRDPRFPHGRRRHRGRAALRRGYPRRAALPVGAARRGAREACGCAQGRPLRRPDRRRRPATPARSRAPTRCSMPRCAAPAPCA